MKRHFVPIVLAAAMVALAGCTGHDAVNQTAGGEFPFVSANQLGTTYAPADRKRAGDFVGTLLDGAKISLAEQRGKVVVVNYWAP